MKALFLLLLAANVAWYGWHYNQATSRRLLQLREREAVRPLPQGIPRLRLLSELKTLPPGRGAEEETAPPPPPPEAPPAAHPPAGEAVLCYTLGPFHDPEAARGLKEWLQQADYRAWTRREQRQVRTHFWVYLEPATTEEAAREKLQELAHKGVQDYQLIRRGNLRGAISLGLFRHRESVTRRLSELKREGYQPVVVPRYRTRTEYWVDFAPPPAVAVTWEEGAEPPRRISCPAIANDSDASYNATATPE